MLSPGAATAAAAVLFYFSIRQTSLFDCARAEEEEDSLETAFCTVAVRALHSLHSDRARDGAAVVFFHASMV